MGEGRSCARSTVAADTQCRRLAPSRSNRFTANAFSGSEATRLIEGGGVRVDSSVVSDKALKLGTGTYVVQVGKRKFARVTVQ